MPSTNYLIEVSLSLFNEFAYFHLSEIPKLLRIDLVILILSLGMDLTSIMMDVRTLTFLIAKVIRST